MTNLDCSRRPQWSRLLLQQVSPHLQELQMTNAEEEHLALVRDMPALLRLQLDVRCIGSQSLADLPPPPQLQELRLLSATPQHLLSLQCLPRLRKLSLWIQHDKMSDLVPPAVPEDHCGLQSLTVCVHPRATIMALIKAHGSTLRELQLCVSTYYDNVVHYVRDLHLELARCGLRSLQRLVLRRQCGGKLSHGDSRCREQKKKIWDQLMEMDSAAGRIRTVTVLCSVCDEC